jgi:hypothetical protein
VSELDEVTCEGDGNSGHAARLDNEQQNPAIQKCHTRMKRFSQVSILAANVGACRSEFCPNKSRRKCEQPTKYPCAKNQERSTNLKRNYGRVHKDARPNNAAHDDHGGIEETEFSR